MSSGDAKLVSYPLDRCDVIFADLLPYFANVYIHCACHHIYVTSPDVLQQFVTGEDLVRTVREEIQ